MQDDGGAARRLLRLLDRELALAVRDPAPSGALAGLARDDLDLVGDHEGGIEADAELADQGKILVFLGLVAGQVLHEGGGAGARDGAEILDQLVAVHADAVIVDGKGAGRLVGGQDDAEFAVLAGERGLRQRRVAQAVAGVRSVRDQLAKKDLLLAIERMSDDIEEAADLGLKAAFLNRHDFDVPRAKLVIEGFRRYVQERAMAQGSSRPERN